MNGAHSFLGSARASRAGDGALAIASFLFLRKQSLDTSVRSSFRRGAETSTRGRVRSPALCIAAASVAVLLQVMAGTGESKSLQIDLPTTLRLAGARNIDIQLAREKLAEAYAGEESAIERFFPWVAPGITYRRHDNLIQNTEGVIEEVHKQSYAPGGTVLAQTDIGDAIFKSLEAHQVTKAARHGVGAQQQETILAAARGYFDLAAAHQAVGVAWESLRVSSDYAAEIDRAVNAGIAFKGDALRVKVQQQRDEIALRRAEENARLASSKLVQILHLDPIVELKPRDTSVVPLSIVSAKESPGDLVSQALAARPETEQSAALVSAAQHAKNGSIYGPLIPSVGGQAFFGGLGGGMNGETGHFGEAEDYVALLTWRIGPGGLFDFGNIHARQARLRSAAFTADKVIDQVANEVITSQTRVQSLADQIATARQSLSDAAEALRLGQERKEFGVGVVLETILAEQDLARARNDYLNIVTDYNKTQYALLRALGRLSPPSPSASARSSSLNRQRAIGSIAPTSE